MEDEKILIRNASQVVTCSGFEAKKGKAMSDVGIIEDGAVAVFCQGLWIAIRTSSSVVTARRSSLGG